MHFDKNDLAFDQFKIVTEMERSNYKAWCQMGIIRLELQRFEEAAKYIKRSIEYKQDYVPSLVAMGNIFYESGHSETAAKYFQRAI